MLSSIGAVTFYRDMFPRRHILAPLTELTKGSPKKIVWTDRHQKAFDTMKAVMAQDVMIWYPDHNLPFHVYTDASDFKLSAIIMQNGAPVAFYSRKLNAAQRNYSVIEKELLLTVVEILREYGTMLFGSKELLVHTDHRNLMFNKLTSQQVIQWRLFLEEFHLVLHYIKGDDNSLVDILSRLPRLEEQSAITQRCAPAELPSLMENCSSFVASPGSTFDDDEGTFKYAFYAATEDDDLLQCFLNFPDMDDDTSPHPLDF